MSPASLFLRLFAIAVAVVGAFTPLVAAAMPPTAVAPSSAFSSLLTTGLDDVNAKLLDADKMARAFALDDSTPVHQVTYALEQARLSLDLMMQVRSRLIEGYQQLMNMQL